MKELLYKVLFHLMRKGPKWGNLVMDIIGIDKHNEIIHYGFAHNWDKK